MRHLACCLGLAALLLISCRPKVPVYVPASVHLGSDDIVYLHDPAGERIHRYAPSTRGYLAPIPIAPDSRHVVYHPAHHALYVAYGDGAVTAIDLAAGLVESPFVQLDAAAHGLTPVGPLLFAASDGHIRTFAADGSLLAELGSSSSWNQAVEFVWSPANERLYQTGDPVSPFDIRWIRIDPATGAFSGGGDGPFHGGIPIANPLRVSPDGAELFLGPGQIYDGLSLDIRDAVPVDASAAIWSQDELLTASETPAGDTRLDHWASDRTLLDSRPYNGRPLRILERPGGFLVVSQGSVRPKFHTYLPTDDPDGDGFPNPVDRFPLDPAASLDSDGDGHPDAWNPGADAADSTQGLQLDAFPQDSACWLDSHGAGGVCDVAASIPAFDPKEVIVGSDEVVYLLSPENARVYRWSFADAAWLNPLVTSADPQFMAYSASLHRLYLGYTSGAITRIDLHGELREEAFAATFTDLTGLAVADPHVFASDPFGHGSYYTFGSDGARIDRRTGFLTHRSDHWTWSSAHSRLYHLRDDLTPNDLEFQEIDSGTGAMATYGDSPHHGGIDVHGPIRVKDDGTKVILGSGNVYDGASLQILASLPVDVTDALWLGDDLLTLRPDASGADTRLEHWLPDLGPYNAGSYAGTPIRVLGWSGGPVVLTSVGGHPTFQDYVATDDADADGTPNDTDAFPEDPAAALDSDRDGHPDAWNPGMGSADSTTGLVLDAFPQDSACWLPAHGAGGVCDIAARIPTYLPDRIEVGGDIVYLLSAAEQRIYRWSTSLAQDLNPIVLGGDPRDMAYAPDLQRLYVGYGDGRITFVDLAGEPFEQPFAVLLTAVKHLGAAGTTLFAGADPFWAHTFDPSGNRITWESWLWTDDYLPRFEWSAAHERLYFVDERGSWGDVYWYPIDAATGVLSFHQNSPYHAEMVIEPPVRLSPDSTRLVLGTGQIWDAILMEWIDSLPHPIHDALWTPDWLLTIRDPGDGTTTGEQWDPATQAPWSSDGLPGTPLRVLPAPGGAVVVTSFAGRPSFHLYTPPADADADGVANPNDDFPADPAASLDSDADGAPDAWNPGMGPGDSTTGLAALDAFPDDFACQTPAHGVGGVCDFSLIVPPDPLDPLCSSDDVTGIPASGLLAVPAAVGLLPLCDGWIAYGHAEDRRVVVQDVVSGRLALDVPLPGDPWDVTLDAAGKRLFVAVGYPATVVEIDLVTRATVGYAFPEPARALHVGTGSHLIVETAYQVDETRRDVYRFDLDTQLVEGPFYLGHHWEMAYHPGRDEGYSVSRWSTPARLQRIALDFPNPPAFMDNASWGYSGLAVALSPDHGQVAFATYDVNGDAIAHYASDDLQTLLGVWRAADYPWDVQFDATGTRIAVSSNDSLQIFDVATYGLLQELPVPACSDGSLHEVGFSRGGDLAFVKQECGPDAETAELHWLRLD